MAESWAPDGTQEPAPPPPSSDPLAGLVTGAVYEPEPFTFKVAKPAMPDMDEVRKAVDAVLGEEEAAETPGAEPASRRRPPPRSTAITATSPSAATTPGMVPPNPRPGWPGSAVVRRLPGVPSGGLRPAPIPKAALQRGRRAPSAGVGGVIVLIIVIIVILWIVINSLVETISGILE